MKFPKLTVPQAKLIDRDLLERELLKEARENGFKTREEYIKHKNEQYTGNTSLNYIDYRYNSNENEKY